ncbi:MAG: S-methyl-5-thioribose kinase [Curvibacter sp.]|nr:S-methyl-5-thioribose kinase [Curvibacter sp.]
MPLDDLSVDPQARYRVLAAADIPALLAAWPTLARRLGGAPGDWQVRDVADGNLNSVFLVQGPQGRLCVKQSLPYVRVAKDDWPLSVERAYFESEYLRRVQPFVPGLVPEFLHFDADLRVIVMEALHPHIILRQALMAGRRPQGAAAAVADFAAATLFHTSDLSNPFERKFEDVARFSANHDLQRITVDLVFIDPFQEHPRNRYARPDLEGWARALREDGRILRAVAHWRQCYLNKPQALLHGDLHSGSVMVSEDDARVIDGEFAWVGPIGFDCGMFLANWLLAWFARVGLGESVEDPAGQPAWIQAQAELFWQRFRQQFLHHWQGWRGAGDAFPTGHFGAGSTDAGWAAVQQAYLDEVWADARGFVAIELIRRIIGFSQVADFGLIADTARCSRAQAGALALARDLLLHPAQYPDIQALGASLPRWAGASLAPAAADRAGAALV